jgi:hypothetical protein
MTFQRRLREDADERALDLLKRIRKSSRFLVASFMTSLITCISQAVMMRCWLIFIDTISNGRLGAAYGIVMGNPGLENQAAISGDARVERSCNPFLTCQLRLGVARK